MIITKVYEDLSSTGRIDLDDNTYSECLTLLGEVRTFFDVRDFSHCSISLIRLFRKETG